MLVADTLMDRLKRGTREQHALLESLPYFLALKDGTLVLESYLAHLRALAIIHGALEHELRLIHHPAVSLVWQGSMARLGELLLDLEVFADRPGPGIAEPTQVALEVADQIRLHGMRTPVALLGYLYVLEGSALGAKQIGPLIQAALGLTGGGAGYLSQGAAHTDDRWSGFRVRLQQAIGTPVDEQLVLDGARELFGALARIFRAAHPYDPSLMTFSIAAINPEAGRHPIPDDPAEVRAALAAADEALQRMPYFALRFGERGRRFARSDSLWLTTLAVLEQPMVDRQVAWLAGVLAARGMPSWTLQIHLEILHRALCSGVPDRSASYSRLQVAARGLADRRIGSISDETIARLSASLGRVSGSAVALIPEAAWLVASAVADEQAGLRGAVTSLVAWLADPARFSETFAGAVNHAVAELRATARPVVVRAPLS